MAIFPILFLGKISQENVFYDILEGKDAFLGFKNKKFKKSKNCHFSKGVSSWFWCKKCHFSNFFFLGNIGQENVFYDILEGLSRLQKREVQKLKNWHFSKEVNPWIWSKNGHFSNVFFLGKIGKGEGHLRHSRTKKHLSRL